LSSFVFAVLCLPLLVHCVPPTYSSLIGSWSTSGVLTPQGCNINVQFGLRHFLSFSTGDRCGAPGMYGGVFEIKGSVGDEANAVLKYSYYPDAAMPDLPARMWMSPDASTFTLTPADQPTFKFARLAPRPWDGVWDGYVTGPNIHVRAAIVGDVMLSYGVPAMNITNLGLAQVFQKDSSTFVNLTYVVSTTLPPRTVLTAGWRADPPFAPTSILVVGQDFTTTLDYKRPRDILHGSWVSVNAGRSTCILFNNGLWRTSLVDGGATNMALFGTYEVNSTHVAVDYDLTNQSQFPFIGMTKEFPYNMTSDHGTTFLALDLSSVGTQPPIMVFTLLT